MNTINFKHLYFDVPENANTSTDYEPAISIDHQDRYVENINKLREILGITAMTPVSAGVIKRYATTVNMGGKQPAECDIIPLSDVQRKPLADIPVDLDMYRKLTSAQAINKVGSQIAINHSDTALIKKIQNDIKKKFYTFVTAANGTDAGSGENMQKAVAKAWGSLETYNEDKDSTPVWFVNPMDVAEYLGNATISTQTAFGFDYFENFMGMGVALVSSAIPQGTVYATAQENLNGAFVPVSSDVARQFELTYDTTGLVGITHSRADDRGSIQTLIMTGVVFYVEDDKGVIKATISAG